MKYGLRKMTRKRWNWNGVIQELERQAEEERKARENGEEQLRLMEKSYEMAARYMPGGGETKTGRRVLLYG